MSKTIAVVAAIAAVVCCTANIHVVMNPDVEKIYSAPRCGGPRDVAVRPHVKFLNKSELSADEPGALLVLDRFHLPWKPQDIREQTVVAYDGTVRFGVEGTVRARLSSKQLDELRTHLEQLRDIDIDSLRSECDADFRSRFWFPAKYTGERTLQCQVDDWKFSAEWWDASQRSQSKTVSRVYRNVRGIISAAVLPSQMSIVECRRLLKHDVTHYFPDLQKTDIPERPVNVQWQQQNGRPELLVWEWPSDTGFFFADVDVTGTSPVVRYIEFRGPNADAARILQQSPVALPGRPLMRGQVVSESTEAVPSFTVHASAGLHTLRRFDSGDFVWKGRYYDGYRHSIEAAGYVPSTSRRIAPQKTVSRRLYRLRRSAGLDGLVLDSTGNPVSGATVVQADSTRRGILRNGWFRPRDPAEIKTERDRRSQPEIVMSDSDGRFHISDWNRLSVVAAAHPDHGFAFGTTTQLRQGEPLKMVPWASVRGTVRWNGKPAEGAKISVYVFQFESAETADRVPRHMSQSDFIYGGAELRADNAGRFSAPFIPPGRISVGHVLVPKSHPEPIVSAEIPKFRLKLEPRQQLTVLFGGPGRTIRGRLTGRNSWHDIRVSLRLKSIPRLKVRWVPRDIEVNRVLSAAEQEFRQEIGQQYYRRDIPVDADGPFEIRDVPAGNYNLIASDGEVSYLERLGYISTPDVTFRAGRTVEITPFSETETGEAIDLGEITEDVPVITAGPPLTVDG